MVTSALRPVTGRLTPRISSVPAWRLSVKLVLYDASTMVVVTGCISARCCAAFRSCSCASVGLLGLPCPVQTLYGLLWVSSTTICVLFCGLFVCVVGCLLFLL